jgi:hypothetical protein
VSYGSETNGGRCNEEHGDSGNRALIVALAGSSPAHKPPKKHKDNFVAYELKDKEPINTQVTVTTPFATGTIQLRKTHRLFVPDGMNGASPMNPDLHYLGVEADAGTYDPSTTPARTFTTSLGVMTFTPAQIRFFYDPAFKSLTPPVPPAPPVTAPLLCFVAKSGSKAPKADVTTTDQFGTQNPSITRFAYACVAASLSGSAPRASWVVCLNQKTKNPVKPPDVFLTTQDLGSFADLRVDPLDEVCVQAQVQP